jgi:hypothetical protein
MVDCGGGVYGCVVEQSTEFEPEVGKCYIVSNDWFYDINLPEDFAPRSSSRLAAVDGYWLERKDLVYF